MSGLYKLHRINCEYQIVTTLFLHQALHLCMWNGSVTVVHILATINFHEINDSFKHFERHRRKRSSIQKHTLKGQPHEGELID